MRNEQIIGAWSAGTGARRGKTGLLIVYRTAFGTAHAGDLRKPWRVPQGSRLSIVEEGVRPSFVSVWSKLNPLLTCDDKTLAEAFERLVKEPALAKISLSDWEFRLAVDAPSVFLKWGGFTWKQRKYLHEIVKKISGKWIE